MSAYSSLFDDTEQPVAEAARWWVWVSEFLLMVYELIWVTLWYQIALPLLYSAAPWKNILFLAAVMLASFLVCKLMIALRLLRKIQLIVMGVLFLSCLAAASWVLLGGQVGDLAGGLMGLNLDAVYGFTFVFWLWWRGSTLANDGVRPLVVWRRFRFGLLALMVYLFYTAQWRLAILGLGWLLIFLFTGLLAMVFARIAFVGAAKGATRNPFDRRWVLSISGVLMATLLAVGAVGSLLIGQYRIVLDFLAEVTRWLVTAFLLVMSLPAALVAFLLGPLLERFREWMLRQRIESVPTPEPGVAFYTRTVEEYVQTEPSQVMLVLQSICIWVVVILVVAALILRVRKSFVERGFADSEAPESLLERGEAPRLLRKAMGDALQDLLRRFQPLQRRLAAARIRQIYTKFLEMCAELGKPRLPPVTPEEFFRDTQTLFPAGLADLELLTAAYERVRYGELPEAPEEVQAVESAWNRISLEGKRLKQAGAARNPAVEKK